MKLVYQNPAVGDLEAKTATDGVSRDLLLLVLVLPKTRGLEVCKQIRRDQSLNSLPIAMLMARGEEADGIFGNGAGNHVKPSDLRVPMARVKKLLQCAQSPDNHDRVLAIEDLVIDPFSYRVTRAGKRAPLTVLEFRILYYLAARPNRVFTREQLLTAVRCADRCVNPRMIDAYVRRLRVKIESDPEHPAYLKTLTGIGYLFDSMAGQGSR